MRGLMPRAAQAALLMILITSCLTAVNGRSLNRDQLNAFVDRDRESLTSSFERSVCTAPIPVLSQERRDGGLYDSTNGTDHGSNILRRVMRLPDGPDKPSMNEFMRTEIADSDAVVFQNSAGSDTNTALLEVFAGLPVSAGVNHLCGCTTLVILSRSAYFVGHYWESISFAPDLKKWNFKNDQEAFTRSVERVLTGGNGGTSLRPVHPRLASAKRFFDNDRVRAFLITPSARSDWNTIGYPEQWAKMKTIVGGVIPALDPVKFASRWQDVKYLKRRNDDPAPETTAAGSSLIKFDPDHPEDSGKSFLSLWVEWQPIYNDTWT